MKRASAFVRNLRHLTRNHHLNNFKNPPHLQSFPLIKPNPDPRFLTSSHILLKFRSFSSESDNNDSPVSDENGLSESENKKLAVLDGVKDVSSKELKAQIEKYFKGDEEVLPDIFESVLKRKLIGKHEDTDNELLDEFQMQPIKDVKDEEFESDFEEMHETDEELDDLYDAEDHFKSKMAKDEFFNMDVKKWDEMVKEGVEHGFLKDTKECEAILEDMLHWDKLLPDEIKKKVEKKLNQIAAMIEAGEIGEEKGFELFKEYEDKMVLECTKLMEAEAPQENIKSIREVERVKRAGTQFDVRPDIKKDIDDPPGEGPILRWQSRCVFAPGSDAWHPKNRKVKMGVTVKELGLNKHEFRRLRELVGKRYHPGKDELMITSERFEHREENRKDCLRTLYALLEESYKANKLVHDTRTSYVKERLRANPQFMERLRAKTLQKGASLPS